MSVLWTSPAWSWPLLLVVAAGAVFLTIRFYDQSLPHPGKGLRRVLVVLRSGALCLLVLALAGPVFSRLFQEDAPAQIVFLMEDSASMGLEAGSSESDRWQTALGLISQVDSLLSSRGLPVESRILRGNGLTDLQEFHLTDPVIPDPRNHGTNLNVFLEKAGIRLSADPVRAVVLLSDGQETVRRDRATATPAVLGGIELLIAGVGDSRGSPDRLIKDLRYPDTAFQGDRVTVQATVLDRLTEPFAKGKLTAFLKQDDRILAQKTLDAGKGATNFELSFIPDETGLLMLDLEISSLGNERFLANNRVSLGIDVHKARSKLLVLAEKPGWNVRFLIQAANLENRLAMDVVYASRKGLVHADSLLLFKAPGTVAQWLQYDGVILAGWSGLAARLDHDLLGQAVDAGLGLLVLPDLKESITGQLRPPVAGLRELLPVVVDQVRWERGPLFAQPDSLAFEHPVFSGLQLKTGVNPLSDAPPLGAIVGCSVREGSQTLLLALHNQADLSTGVPLLVARSVQAGRSVFWSGSRLWEMAFWEKALSRSETPPEHAVRHILRNLLVWLADGSRESGLSFSGRRAIYQEGEIIRLAAQWKDLRGQPVDQGWLSLEVAKLLPTGAMAESRSFPVNSFDSIRNEFEFLLPAMPPGRYSIQLMGHGNLLVEGPVEELIISSHSVEETQVRQDGRRLRQLADRLGATYYNLHEETALKEIKAQLASLDWSSSPNESRRRWDPSSGWPFLVTMVLLLACEWFLRRRHGLL